MDEKKQTQPRNNFQRFDQLMFGPPRTPVRKPEDQVSNASVTSTESETVNSNTTSENSELPQVDFMKMMEQFDLLMGYANKLGPSLKKFGPLFDLFKGNNGKNDDKLDRHYMFTKLSSLMAKL